MTSKIHLQNAGALIRQEQPDMAFFVKSYQDGVDLAEAMSHSKLLFITSNYGTTPEAVREYIKSNYNVTKPIKTSRRGVAKSKDKE
ncbi:MAG: hypothetical protein V3W44_07835 [Dehalococcoidales bacterium]